MLKKFSVTVAAVFARTKRVFQTLVKRFCKKQCSATHFNYQRCGPKGVFNGAKILVRGGNSGKKSLFSYLSEIENEKLH